MSISPTSFNFDDEIARHILKNMNFKNFLKVVQSGKTEYTRNDLSLILAYNKPLSFVEVARFTLIMENLSIFTKVQNRYRCKFILSDMQKLLELEKVYTLSTSGSVYSPIISENEKVKQDFMVCERCKNQFAFEHYKQTSEIGKCSICGAEDFLFQIGV